jgi:hypothetical protein
MPTNNDLIRNKVESFVKSEQMFTSVDIANSIKKDGSWVRNADVALWLRDNFYGSDIFLDYKTSPVAVCNNSRSATLYAPEWCDPDNYTNRNQEAITPNDFDQLKNKKVAAAPKTDPVDIVDMLSGKKTPKASVTLYKVIKSKERIKIPGAIIRKLGYAPGDKVPNDIVKSHSSIPGDLIVNKDYRFSIPRSAVKWGTDPILVLLTSDNKISFEKA